MSTSLHDTSVFARKQADTSSDQGNISRIGGISNIEHESAMTILNLPATTVTETHIQNYVRRENTSTSTHIRMTKFQATIRERSGL